MATSYISRTQSANGSGKLTISVWLKHCEAAEQLVVTSYYSGNYWGDLRFLSDGAIKFQDYRNSYIFQLQTTAKFRDPASWYHVVVNFDNTLASPTGKIYVNGVLQDLATTNQYSQNETSSFLTDYTLNIGTYNSGSNWNGSMADLYYIQGQVYEASTFGSTDSTTGQWKPNASPTIDYSSTGNNSFHMKFENASNLDLDSGGNNLTFSTTGTPTQTSDCPSNNFATWNTLNGLFSNSIQSNGVQNGNTFVASTASNEDRSFGSTLAFTGTGKYYMEFKVGNLGGGVSIGIGEVDAMQVLLNQTRSKFCNNAKGYAYLNSGNKEVGGSGASYGNSFTNYSYIQLAYNNGTLWFGKDGTWQNSATISEISAGTTTNAAFTGIDTSKQYFIMFNGFNDAMLEMNAGNGYFRTTVIGSPNNPTSGDTSAKFKYTVPTGYQPLSTKGLNV